MKRKNVSWVLGLGLVVAAGACGGFGSAPSDPSANADAGTDSAPPPSLSADPRLFLKVLPVAPQKLVVGGKLSLLVRIERNGFEGDVELTVRNAPKDVSVVSAKLRTESEGTLELAAPETAQTQPVKVDLVAITSLGNVQVSFELDIRGAFGTLDKSFGGGVVYLKSATDGPQDRQMVNGALVQSDGKVVVLTRDRLYRVSEFGVPEPDFGKGIDLDATSISQLKLGGVQFIIGMSPQSVAVRRLLVDGSTDGAWVGGTVTDASGWEIFRPRAVEAPDGGAYVSWISTNAELGKAKFCVARLNPTGQLDSTWDGGAYCAGEYFASAGAYYNYVRSIDLRLRGGLFEGYWLRGAPQSNVSELVVLRVGADGVPDLSIGVNGVRVVGLPYYETYGIARSSRDEIYLGGQFNSATSVTLRVSRLTAGRTLDNTFGAATGTVNLPFAGVSGLFPQGAAVDELDRFYLPLQANGVTGFYRVGVDGAPEPSVPARVPIPDAIPGSTLYSTVTSALLGTSGGRTYVVAGGRRIAVARVWQ